MKKTNAGHIASDLRKTSRLLNRIPEDSDQEHEFLREKYQVKCEELTRSLRFRSPKKVKKAKYLKR